MLTAVAVMTGNRCHKIRWTINCRPLQNDVSTRPWQSVNVVLRANSPKNKPFSPRSSHVKSSAKSKTEVKQYPQQLTNHKSPQRTKLASICNSDPSRARNNLVEKPLQLHSIDIYFKLCVLSACQRWAGQRAANEYPSGMASVLLVAADNSFEHE